MPQVYRSKMTDTADVVLSTPTLDAQEVSMEIDKTESIPDEGATASATETVELVLKRDLESIMSIPDLTNEKVAKIDLDWLEWVMTQEDLPLHEHHLFDLLIRWLVAHGTSNLDRSSRLLTHVRWGLLYRCDLNIVNLLTPISSNTQSHKMETQTKFLLDVLSWWTQARARNKPVTRNIRPGDWFSAFSMTATEIKGTEPIVIKQSVAVGEILFLITFRGIDNGMVVLLQCLESLRARSVTADVSLEIIVATREGPAAVKGHEIPFRTRGILSSSRVASGATGEVVEELTIGQLNTDPHVRQTKKTIHIYARVELHGIMHAPACPCSGLIHQF